MTVIAIKDLPENADLDRQAMRAIAGGARTGGRQHFAAGPLVRSARVIDYPGGPAGSHATGHRQPTRK